MAGLGDFMDARFRSADARSCRAMYSGTLSRAMVRAPDLKPPGTLTSFTNAIQPHAFSRPLDCVHGRPCCGGAADPACWHGRGARLGSRDLPRPYNGSTPDTKDWKISAWLE